MDSLGLGILDYLLLGKVKVYYMRPSEIKINATKTFDTIWKRGETYQLSANDPGFFNADRIKYK